MLLSTFRSSGALYGAPRAYNHYLPVNYLHCDIRLLNDTRCCMTRASITAVDTDKASVASKTSEPSQASSSSSDSSHTFESPSHLAGIRIIYRTPQPLIEETSGSCVDQAASKPFMLQLPNLDGTCSMSASNMSSLSRACELHSLHIERGYSGSFEDLVECIKVGSSRFT
jgi:hypothetical protein